MRFVVAFVVLAFFANCFSHATKLGPFEYGSVDEAIEAWWDNGMTGTINYNCKSYYPVEGDMRDFGDVEVINELLRTKDVVEFHMDNFLASRYSNGWHYYIGIQKPDGNYAQFIRTENERPWGLHLHFLMSNGVEDYIQMPWFTYYDNIGSFRWTEGTAERPIGNLHQLTPELCKYWGWVGGEMEAAGNAAKYYSASYETTWQTGECVGQWGRGMRDGLRITYRFVYDALEDKTEVKQFVNGVEWPDWKGRTPRAADNPKKYWGRLQLPAGNFGVYQPQCHYCRNNGCKEGFETFDFYVTDYISPWTQSLVDPIYTMGFNQDGNLVKCADDACEEQQSDGSYRATTTTITSPVTLTGEFQSLSNGDEVKIVDGTTYLRKPDGTVIATHSSCD